MEAAEVEKHSVDADHLPIAWSSCLLCHRWAVVEPLVVKFVVELVQFAAAWLSGGYQAVHAYQ